MTFTLGIIFLILYFVTTKKLKDIDNQNNISNVNEEAVKAIVDAVKEKSHYLSFSVAGVTFKNGRQSRQTLLRKIKFNDEPFEQINSFDIEQYEYEGLPAYSILVNSFCIGNIPKSIIDEYEKYKDYECSITALDITGGGTDLNFGCNLTLKFIL